jgi:hypothetical protein
MQCDAPGCDLEATNHVTVVLIGDEFDKLEFKVCNQHAHEIAACDDDAKRVTVRSLMESRA